MMKILTRDETVHGVEYVERAEALAALAELAELAVTRGMLNASGNLIDALQVDGVTLRGQLAKAIKLVHEMQDAVERLRTELAETRKDYAEGGGQARRNAGLKTEN